MKVIMNDKEVELEEGTTVKDIVEQEKKRIGRVGVWVNDKMVRQKQYEEYIIKEGDVLLVKRIGCGG